MRSSGVTVRKGGWIRSAGSLYFVLTVAPIAAGIHIGSYFHHETTGALLGVIVGQALAVWIVIRPIWLEANDNARGKRKDD